MNNAPPLSNSPQQAYASLSERATGQYEQLPDIQPDALRAHGMTLLFAYSLESSLIYPKFQLLDLAATRSLLARTSYLPFPTPLLLRVPVL